MTINYYQRDRLYAIIAPMKTGIREQLLIKRLEKTLTFGEAAEERMADLMESGQPADLAQALQLGQRLQVEIEDESLIGFIETALDHKIEVQGAGSGLWEDHHFWALLEEAGRTGKALQMLAGASAIPAQGPARELMLKRGLVPDDLAEEFADVLGAYQAEDETEPPAEDQST
jgi:hypothetical protein